MDALIFSVLPFLGVCMKKNCCLCLTEKQSGKALAGLLVFVLCASLIFTGCKPQSKVKINDPVKYSSVLALDKTLFAEIKKGDTITIKTKKCGILKKPDASITKPKIKLVLNDEDNSALAGGKYSENAVFNKNYKNADLQNAEQTITYTVSAKEASKLKEKGLVILGYGAEVSVAKLSCIDYAPIDGTEINTGISSKYYFAENFHSGWNLGNYLDTIGSGKNKGFSAAENWSKEEATPELFKNLRTLGFDFVRIPVTYLNHIGEAPDYRINAEWLAYVKKVVDMALAEDLGVLINIHHDGADTNQWLNISKADDNEANYKNQTIQFCQIWSQVAEAFKDYGSKLAFEGFNEIQDGKWGWGDNRSDDGIQYAIINRWNQAFTAVVRATGGNNAYRFLA